MGQIIDTIYFPIVLNTRTKHGSSTITFSPN